MCWTLWVFKCKLQLDFAKFVQLLVEKLLYFVFYFDNHVMHNWRQCKYLHSNFCMNHYDVLSLELSEDGRNPLLSWFHSDLLFFCNCDMLSAEMEAFLLIWKVNWKINSLLVTSLKETAQRRIMTNEAEVGHRTPTHPSIHFTVT